MDPTASPFPQLLDDIRRCEICTAHLPLGPRPVVQAGPRARLLIIGQAPGTRVHQSGIPWDDASGDHLRTWLGIDRDRFYDPNHVALMPMGFCYPGKGRGGDAPPRPECAPRWHSVLKQALPETTCVVLTGRYAHAYYLGPRRKKTLTETVQAFETYLPDLWALPHPSWRSKIWMKKNPWFEAEVLPALRGAVSEALLPSSVAR